MGGRLTLELPKYVSAFRDRHGKTRYRFRRVGFKTHYPKSNYPSKEFDAELDSWKHQDIAIETNRSVTKPGSIDDLAVRFISSTSFKENPTTIKKKRAIIERFRDKKSLSGIRQGDRPATTCPYAIVDNYIIELSIKQTNGRGGPEAANRARKTLKAMFDFGIKIGLMRENPMRYVETIPSKTTGFHSWTEDEISKYLKAYPLGTMARLAFDIML